MSEKKRNFIVGLMALASLGCLVIMLLLFGYVPRFLEKNYVVKVALPDAGGLYTGARVWYGGVDIGSVAEITRPDQLRPQVILTAKINDTQPLPEGLSAFVYEPLIGGSPRLILELPAPLNVTPDVTPNATSGANPTATVKLTALPTDGSAQITGRLSSPAEAFTKGIQDQFGDSFDALSRIGNTLDSIEQLANTWKQVGDQMADLTQARSTDDVDQGQAVGNISTLVARADQRMAEIQTVIADIQAITGDQAFATDIKTTAHNSAQLTQELKDSATRLEANIQQTLTNVETQLTGSLGDLSTRYTTVADQLLSTADSVKQLADAAREGDGTMGLILKDPALYHNLNDAAERLNQAIATFQATLETWTHDGLPVKL